MFWRKQRKPKVSKKILKSAKNLKDMGFHIPIETPKKKYPPVLRPFVWTERRLENVLAWLRRLALLEILAIISNVGILFAIVTYAATEKQRRDEVVFTAWQTITSAEGQPGSGGRIQALEFLNASPGADWQRRAICLWLCYWEPESLAGINLSTSDEEESVYLAGVNLTYANLWNADLTYANLRNADLTNANLLAANLKDVALWNADLTNANLIGTDLTNANLREADFTNANLREADLTNANLRRAKLTEANLYKANLTKANLERVDLTNTELIAADLTDANLESADLTNTNLVAADLTNANLENTNIANAVLCESILPKDIEINPNKDCSNPEVLIAPVIEIPRRRNRWLFF